MEGLCRDPYLCEGALIFVKGTLTCLKYTLVLLCRVLLEALCRDPYLCEGARSFVKGTLMFYNTLWFGYVVSRWKLCAGTLFFVEGPLSL